MTVRAIPGYKWDTRNNVYRFQASPSTALALKKAFEGYRRRGSKDFLELIKQADGRVEAQKLKHRTDLPEIPWLKNGGWSHQRSAWAFLIHTLVGENPYDKDGDIK
jgi:hypothetical protein